MVQSDNGQIYCIFLIKHGTQTWRLCRPSNTISHFQGKLFCTKIVHTDVVIFPVAYWCWVPLGCVYLFIHTEILGDTSEVCSNYTITLVHVCVIIQVSTRYLDHIKILNINDSKWRIGSDYGCCRCYFWIDASLNLCAKDLGTIEVTLRIVTILVVNPFVLCRIVTYSYRIVELI